MGSGNWSKQAYEDMRAYEVSTNTDPFAYAQVSAQVKATTGSHRLHASLDVYGPKIRESCDSKEHPNSLAIGAVLDVTGSMETLPRAMLASLADLHVLLEKNDVRDAQVLFGAVGDCENSYGPSCPGDDLPIQLGQFESDNRGEEHLKNIVPEGGGCGQKHESYDMILYYFARHVRHDCWLKRGRKGYLFLMGDEFPRDVNRAHVQTYFGEHIEANIPIASIMAEAQKKWHVFFVVPTAISSYANDEEVQSAWKKLVGNEHVLKISDPKAIASLIATTVSLHEGTVDLDESMANMRAAGVSAAIVKAVSQSVDPLARKSAGMARVAVGGLTAATTPAVARL